jgi:hypothetical protein
MNGGKKTYTHMEVAVSKARRLLVLWGSEKESIEGESDDAILAMALIVADRAVARHKAGIEYRPPCD